MVQMNLQWNAETGDLSFAIPPTWSADTCVLFSGREVKRVEFHDRAPAQARMTAWDSCNGPSVAYPTPISGGYATFEDDGDDAGRDVVVRALHSGGVTCYMEHGPAMLRFDGAPEITPRAICLGVEAATARFAITDGETIEVVLVIRSDAQSGGSARELTEAIVRELLRERIDDPGGHGWPDVKMVA